MAELKEAQHKGRFMAVAVNKDAELQTGGAALSLAGASLAGTIYVIAGFLLVYHGIHYVWETQLGGGAENVSFFTRALLLVLMVGGAAGLMLLFPRFLRPQPGLRAGVGFGVMFCLVGFFALYALGRIVEGLFDWLAPGLAAKPIVGGVIIGLAALALLRWGWRTINKDSARNWLRNVEDHGWFSIGTYKRGQGLKARRGTMLGLMLLVLSGIWVYSWKRGLAGAATWAVNVPFLDPRDWELVLLRSPRITGSILLAGIAIWVAYRLINYPRFADFLIATEAEMHKVSWASQKKLVQDTMVVLVTLVMMSVFLFVVDLLWSFLLTKINVLLQ